MFLFLEKPNSEWQTRLANQNAQTEHTSLLTASSESIPAELSRFSKVEMAVLGSLSLMSLMVTVDVKQHWNETTEQLKQLGAGIAQWLERRTRDSRSRVRIPAAAAGEFFSPGSTFCADSYSGIRSTPVLPQQHVKDPGHSARTCAETAAVSCSTSHASAVSTALRWIFKKRAIKL